MIMQKNLKERKIVEVTMEMALSGKLLGSLKERLHAAGVYTDEQIEEEMRKAAMSTSVGGIGPLLKETCDCYGRSWSRCACDFSIIYTRMGFKKVDEEGKSYGCERRGLHHILKNC